MPEPGPDSRVRLLIVTGSGRSGTSTVTGALSRLGLHVPQPEVPADDTNPRGFYEPQWVVEFHRRLLDTLPARPNDARPSTAARVSEVVAAPEVRAELTTWLAGQVAEVGPGGQLIVKDPCTFWMHELWSGVADDLDIDLSYLTMLRHPAEVVLSRDTNYLSDKPDEFRRTRQTANLAGWVNTARAIEVATRSRPRAVVRYADLLADWRAEITRVAARTGITLDTDLSSTEHHAVDDFVDVKLHRTKVSWDGVDTLPELQAVAADAWDAWDVLVDAPYDEGAIAALAETHERYSVLHEYAASIVVDHTTASIAEERRAQKATLKAAHAEATRDLKQKLERRRRQATRLEKRVEQQRARIHELRERQSQRLEKVREENARLREQLTAATAWSWRRPWRR